MQNAHWDPKEQNRSLSYPYGITVPLLLKLDKKNCEKVAFYVKGTSENMQLLKWTLLKICYLMKK